MADRFVVVTLEQTTSPSNTSRILVAVSQTNDPNGGWWFTSINSAVTITSLCLGDYPGLAVTDDAILITNNMFSFSGNWHFPRIQDSGLFRRASFYSGGVASVVRYDPSTLARDRKPEFYYATCTYVWYIAVWREILSCCFRVVLPVPLIILV